MGSKAPPGAPDEEQRPLEGEAMSVGYANAPHAIDSLIPASQLAPLIEAHVGKMKAEVREEFQQKLDRINHLPTLTQMILTNIGLIIAALLAFYAVASYFGDREDHAIDRSATIASALGRIETKQDVGGTTNETRTQPSGSQKAKPAR